MAREPKEKFAGEEGAAERRSFARRERERLLERERAARAEAERRPKKPGPSWRG